MNPHPIHPQKHAANPQSVTYAPTRARFDMRSARWAPAGALATAALVTAMFAQAMPASAQDKPTDTKRLYCWNDNGRKVCSDALPASAVNQQRTEFNQKSGQAVKQVTRALTDAERAQAAVAEKSAEAAADRQRKEMAMVQTFDTEADLERSFRNRFDVLEESLKTATLATGSLRQSLFGLLRQANELELNSKQVSKAMANRILSQREELKNLIASEERQRQERAALDGELKAALARYRQLKTSAAPGATAPAAEGH